jgi:hypothetical protein
MTAEPHLDRDIHATCARLAARHRQDQRDRRPRLVHLGDIAITASHRDFADPAASTGHAVHVELIRAGQSRPFADTEWEALLRFELDGNPWQLMAPEVEAVAIVLATALLRPSVAMRVKTLNEAVAGCWRVLVLKPYTGWD